MPASAFKIKEEEEDKTTRIFVCITLKNIEQSGNKVREAHLRRWKKRTRF